MTQEKFEENADTIKRVRWGAYQPEDVEDNYHLVKKGETLEGVVSVINLQNFDGDDGETKEKPVVIFKLKDGKEVTFVCPARLQTQMGLNPTWPKKHVAKEGSKLRILYNGVDKSAKGNPHSFGVEFAV